MRGARDKAVESGEDDGETDRPRGVVQTDNPTFDRRQNGIKSTSEIADCECAGQEVNAAPQPMIARLEKPEILLVRFFHCHRASTLTPPDTCWPGRVTISASSGSQ